MGWFENLSKKQQEQYLSKHTKSTKKSGSGDRSKSTPSEKSGSKNNVAGALKQLSDAANKGALMYDRKDAHTISVATEGYKTFNHMSVGTFLTKSGFTMVDEKFDKVSGMTIGIYKHK